MLGLLLTVIVLALICGLCLWALSALPWIDANIKQLIRVFVIVIFGIWLILILAGAVGVNTGIGSLSHPVLR